MARRLLVVEDRESLRRMLVRARELAPESDPEAHARVSAALEALGHSEPVSSP